VDIIVKQKKNKTSDQHLLTSPHTKKKETRESHGYGRCI
jgi:hypothetical protein